MPYFLRAILPIILLLNNDLHAQLCTGSLGDPVVNITFGSGSNPGQSLQTVVPGASTTYTYVSVFGNPATPIVFDGEYTITNNVISHPAWFSGALDHTPNDVNGFMAFFNASETPGEFYKQTISGLCGNTRYEFAAWIANVLNPAALIGVKPDITFVIQKTDGTTLATYSTGPINQKSSLTWEQLGFFFSTPVGINTVVLKMINTNVGGNAQPGNDFAIDDITFRPCGPLLSASFNSSSTQLSKSQCGFTPVALYGSASSGYSSPGYLWQVSTNSGATWTDLSASNSLNYTYTPGASGTFSFRILSGEGANISSSLCRVASNPISLIITSPPQVSFTGNSICPTQQGQLQFTITGGTAPYTVVLSDGSTNVILNNLSANALSNITSGPASTTTYNLLSVTDASGCVRSSGFTTPSATITLYASSNSLCNTQPVQPSFTAPDTVCLNTPFAVTNSSTGASSYYWNFCVANLNTAPTGVNLGNVSGNFSAPVFIDYAFYNGNYYGFMTNYAPGKLTRLDFGNSLLNTPTSVNLGNFGNNLPPVVGTEGIQIVYNENKWYAIIVGGDVPTGYPPRLLKVDFGANLTNSNPVVTNWGNLGNMLQPIDLHVFQENNNWYGFIVNSENNTITRFNFSNSFNNTPTAVNLGNLGNLQYPTGIYAINDNGFWRVFIVNAGDNQRIGTLSSLTRLDFGSSLLNVPTAVNLGNPGGLLKHPRDLTILKSCGQIYGFAVNGNPNANDIVRLDFKNNLGAAPTISPLGNIGNLNFPHSISKLFRVNDNIYGFIPNVANNTLTRLQFSGCTNASIPNSTLQNPPNIIYNTPGTYNINLTVDDGLPTQNAFCKQVVVVPPPTHSPTKSYSICEGKNMRVGTTGMSSYIWNTGGTTDSIDITAAGIYWVETSRFGCTNRDSFNVTVVPKPILTVSPAVSACTGDSTQLVAVGASSYSWSPATGLSNSSIANPMATVNSTITYTVTGSSANGCTTSKNVDITALQKPVIVATNDTSVCGITSVQLQALGASQYQWSPATGLNNATISNPVAIASSDIKYVVTGTAADGCKASDSTTINVLTIPVITVSNDTSVCMNKAIQLTASGASQYQWSPATGISSAVIANPVATISSPVIYSVKGTALNGCSSTGTVNIGMKPSPTLVVSKDTLICLNGAARLSAGGGQQYIWSPTTGLDNANISTPVATPAVSTKYFVTATNANGCDATDSIKVSVKSAPVFQVSPANVAVCSSKSMQLSATGGDVYIWQPSKYLSNSNISNPVVQPDSSTVYSVTIKDTYCNVQATIKVPVTVNPSPKIIVSKDNDITCSQPFSQLRASGATTYLWTPAGVLNNPNIDNPIATVNSTTTISVISTNDKGCQSTDSIKVNFLNSGNLEALQLPTAFTPNGDGLNDCFGISSWGNVDVITFNIYNRWGQIIFKGANYLDCWNGSYKGIPQQMGVFPYVLKAKNACGNVERKGTVLLIR